MLQALLFGLAIKVHSETFLSPLFDQAPDKVVVVANAVLPLPATGEVKGVRSMNSHNLPTMLHWIVNQDIRSLQEFHYFLFPRHYGTVWVQVHDDTFTTCLKLEDLDTRLHRSRQRMQSQRGKAGRWHHAPRRHLAVKVVHTGGHGSVAEVAPAHSTSRKALEPVRHDAWDVCILLQVMPETASSPNFIAPLLSLRELRPTAFCFGHCLEQRFRINERDQSHTTPWDLHPIDVNLELQWIKVRNGRLG
mmetsp:Transcript_7870/g.22261  ORF Transcript_7870/g.22261 Transcript_7870/m.22261 type:complete len:248 (-) Transcript_7870:1678-2421(-)